LTKIAVMSVSIRVSFLITPVYCITQTEEPEDSIIFHSSVIFVRILWCNQIL